MSQFNSRYIFASTSPRNPELIPKILEIIEKNKLNGKIYNEDLQKKFYYAWSNSDFGVKGAKNSKDAAFSGRDKLTRAPQALGFIETRNGQPLHITKAGKMLMKKGLFEDVLLHQMLKFQLPSPLHHEGKENKGMFCIKPYLELIHLINELDYLTYQELEIFGMSMINYKKFGEKVIEITDYRTQRKALKGRKSLKQYDEEVKRKVYTKIYSDIIDTKKFETRESKTADANSYMKKKFRNLRDYTDAVFRTLRSSGLLILTGGKTMSISPDRKEEVEFLLKNVSREPKPENTEREKYDDYMYNPELPALLSDNKKAIEDQLVSLKDDVDSIDDKDIYALKSELLSERIKKRNKRVSSQIKKLENKSKEDIKDIINMYELIKRGDVIDAPAMMEWNTWRAITMIDNGKIKYNFLPDDNGIPISTAGGNKADIEGEYGKFNMLVEVTLSRGKRQFDTEGESVPRHVGEKQVESKKTTFALFIANKLEDNVIYHFYTTNIANSKIYKGRVDVIPMDIESFIEFFKHAVKNNISSNDIFSIHEYSCKVANEVFENRKTEEDWYNRVIEYMMKL
ncbi:AlwI family type II restriction endonuclease [Lactobacillus apis]|uniref:AlwI family type II restriction endonuclease n=1 Tax=Lactobacillus apis TaxID=303541 RepID=UPI002430DDC0|nr:AlwI family type II restriction endonuclease [Lactobacillus apis]